jgi:hypothetical protein
MNELDPYAATRYDPLTRHVLALNEAAQPAKAPRAGEKESAAMFEEATARTAGRRYSVVRVIDAARFNNRLDGIEGEWSQELARQRGVNHDPAKPFIPWAALGQRVMLATGTDSGLNIIGLPATRAIDVLIPFTTCLRLGAQVFDGLVGNPLIPRVTTSGESAWPGEVGTATRPTRCRADRRDAQADRGVRRVQPAAFAQGPTVEAWSRTTCSA